MDRKQTLKRLLKKMPLESPTVDFTSSVMEAIQAESIADDTLSLKLAHLLKEHALGSPASNFTFKTVKGLETSRSTMKPLIPSGAWYLIAALMAFLVILVFLPGNSREPKPGVITFLAVQLGEYLSAAFRGLDSFGPLLLMTSAAAIGLLSLERIIRKKLEARR